MSGIQIHPTSVLGPMVRVEPVVSIGAHCVLDGRIAIGARSTLHNGIRLVGDVTIRADCYLEDDVSMQPNTVGSKPLVIGAASHVGAGAVLTAGVKIGANAWIMPASVVVGDVPSHAIVRGNPGVVVGYRRCRRGAGVTVRLVANPAATHEDIE